MLKFQQTDWMYIFCLISAAASLGQLEIKQKTSNLYVEISTFAVKVI